MRQDRIAAGDGIVVDELANVKIMSERGEHARARALCQALVRDNPHNADVHAAMGEVCAADGSWAEAVKWYESALQLDFDPMVMERLAAARGQSIRAGTGGAAGPSVSVPRMAPATPEAEEAGWTRQHIVGVVVAGVVLLSVLAYLVIRSLGHPTEVAETRGPAPTEAAPPGGFLGGAPPTASAPTGTVATTAAAPAATPPVAKYTGAPPVPPGSEPTGQEQTWTTPSPAEIYSRAEQHVLAQMVVEKWREGTSVLPQASVALDDYAGTGIITIRAPLTDDISRFEFDVLAAAYRAAVAAMRADPSLREVVVRCLVRMRSDEGGEENLVVFRARATRESLGHLAGGTEQPTVESLRGGVFASIWWDKETLQKYLQGRAERAAEPPPGQ